MSERLLRYPDTSRLYSWAELRMLSAALGFPSNLLLRRLPSELVKEEPGVRSQGLRRRLDLDCFVVALDSSHNGKSGIYNVKTLRKCLDLLDCSFFSFAELKEARLAFSAYEALDQRGMRLDLRTLLRALKMCRRAISPLKLAHRIKHLQRGLTEPGRLQLYEFLDLLPLCEVQNQVPLQESRAGATQMTPRHIYKLDEASSLLGPEDRRLWQLLDRRFLSEERDYGPVRAVGGKLTGSPVLRLPTAHQTAPGEPAERRTLEVSEAEKQDADESEGWMWVVPVPQLRSASYTPARMEPILSEEELQLTRRRTRALQYDMDTLEERSRWELDWKIDYYLPGHQASSAVTAPPAAVREAQPVRARTAPAPDVFKRLSSHTSRCPSARHAARCDAWRLGIGAPPHPSSPGPPPRDTGTCEERQSLALGPGAGLSGATWCSAPVLATRRSGGPH